MTYPNPEPVSIAFALEDRPRLLDMWSQILDSNRWTEGPFTALFEQRWSEWNRLPSVAFASWSGAALAALHFIDVRGATVLVPSNTYKATVLAALNAGAHVRFVDCNRQDLCMSFTDFKRKAERFAPKAAVLVHIGGHIAFDVEHISGYCRSHGIWLFEDCAHAHGAGWNGRRPGSWGDAGIYSFYATKTISTGEGGMLVSRHPDLLEFARGFRNYGYSAARLHGMNARMSEFTAALGVVQTERLDSIVAWKNEYARRVLDSHFPHRIHFPTGMTSGFYKYIVFTPIAHSSGRVYQHPCHKIFGHRVSLPNTEWGARSHWCVPISYPASHKTRLAIMPEAEGRMTSFGNPVHRV